MKLIAALILGVFISGCSLLGNATKKPVEVVASCFGDGEDQSLYCKSRREEEGKIVTTRCIGSTNQQADPKLRGKCVEKICSPGSNTDCQVKGVFAVLEQYTELTTAQLFNADETAKTSETKFSVKEITKEDPKETQKESAKIGRRGDLKKASRKEAKASEPAEATIRMVSVGKPKTSAEKAAAAAESEADDAGDSMQLVLKPVKKTRTVASVSEAPLNGFKRFCVARTEMNAPKHLRGKCATRTCNRGKCAYQGRKEVVDWAAQSISANTN